MIVPRNVTVGLIADPGLPEQVAEHLAGDLGRELARDFEGSATWRIEISRGTLPLTAAGDIPLVEHAPRLLEDHGWDAVVYLTDLPRRHDTEPMLAEVGPEARAALVSLPVLGAWRVTARTRALLVPLIHSLMDRNEDAAAAVRAAGGTAEPTSSGSPRYLIRPSWMDRMRLLAGMVRNNRPGRLLAALSSTGAAGVGTGAFGIFYATIWTMADSLPPARLALISVAVIMALSFWLIFYNGMWTTDRGIDDQGNPWSDNAATVITVLLSVALMYVVLYLVLLGAALTIITTEYLTSQLHRPASVLDHLRLTWLAASLGMMGGAIGSNFDSDQAIRAATYSRREQERRQRATS
ncbi:hypothetical protein [Georgenia subflava]|uniref:DUF2267 domain-containing protein n=1 Tax=Georgenia subflava TaxID=1622177 RepID=A0A6N7ENC4_9MICO|nr:hypothetical protein [Georgenia subflava]MPV38035.1 hypothetical protein [Georgenia subflava]